MTGVLAPVRLTHRTKSWTESPERDEEKCAAVFRPLPLLKILESITVMILD
jgi:hypothetical protein